MTMTLIGLLLLLAVCWFLTRRKKANLRDALGALDEALLNSPDIGEMFKELKTRRRFVNSKISCFYGLTEREDGKVLETIDFALADYEGGFIITFVNGAPEVWTQNGVRRSIAGLGSRERYVAQQILDLIRTSVGAIPAA